MQSAWDKLERVQGRLNYLDEKRMRVMSARCKEIHEGHVGPSDLFSAQLFDINTELHELWAEKRYLLTLVKEHNDTSWLSPMIKGSADWQGRLRMSKKGLDMSLL